MLFLILHFFLKKLFIIERGREGEREGEKHQLVVSCTLLARDLVHRQALNPLSHTSQGSFSFASYIVAIVSKFLFVSFSY